MAEDADEEQAPVLVPVKGHWMHPTFATHRRQGLLLDATLVAGDTRIEAHKIVLTRLLFAVAAVMKTMKKRAQNLD